MRLNRARAGLVLALLVLSGCGVTDKDIEHWKRTERGPRKITNVLLGSKYSMDLRIHAARALIEMKHPNFNGLDLLNDALYNLPEADRQAIVHGLIDPVSKQLKGTGTGGSGPDESQIRAKDAGFRLLRYANDADKAELGRALLDWIFTDLNGRALAGQYTADQVVLEIGSNAIPRVVQQYTSNDDAIQLAPEVTNYIVQVGDNNGRDLAVEQLIKVSDELLSKATTDRLTAGLVKDGLAANDPRLPEELEKRRKTRIDKIFRAFQLLNRPKAVAYLVKVAQNEEIFKSHRALALLAIAGQVAEADAPELLKIVQLKDKTPAGVRNIAIDRLAETRTTDATIINTLWNFFDQTNGGDEEDGAGGRAFWPRWKAGVAILRLGGSAILPVFMQHLAMPRLPPAPATPPPPARGARAAAPPAAPPPPAPGTPPAPPAPGTFVGYTMVEINNYAQLIGDFTPAPREAMRGMIAQDKNLWVRAVAILYLSVKGEQADLARLQALTADTTELKGPGWNSKMEGQEANSIGKLAAVAKIKLQKLLAKGAPAAAAAPAGAPAPAR